jgi:predicted Zn-dependent protease with MMP-like domain
MWFGKHSARPDGPWGGGASVAGMRDRHARHRRRDVDRRRRPVDGARTRSVERFARLVDDAVATLPKDFLPYLADVQIAVADVPPPDPVGRGDEVLLGLYEGVPRTERDLTPPVLPDRITLFRRPLEARARNRRDLAELVRHTVLHEVAHHFGIDDDRLDELGWG